MPMRLVLFCAFFLLLAFCPVTAFSQTDGLDIPTDSIDKPRKYAIGITYGTSSIAIRDKVISNYRYTGSYSPFVLSFEVNKPTLHTSYWIQFTTNPALQTKTNQGFAYKGDLDEFYPNVKDGLDFSTLHTSIFSFGFNQRYLLNKTSDKSIQVSLGYDATFRNFQKTFRQFDYTNKLTDRVFLIGFVAHAEKTFHSKHHLEYTLTIPILNHAARVLYNENANPTSVTTSKFSILKSILGFSNQLGYHYKLSNTIGLRAYYSLNYLQITFPFKEQVVYNQGNLGLFIHF